VTSARDSGKSSKDGGRARDPNNRETSQKCWRELAQRCLERVLSREVLHEEDSLRRTRDAQYRAVFILPG
jgi:hypothetical protein